MTGRIVLFMLLLLGAAPSAAASVWPSSHQRIARAMASDDVTERRAAASRLLDLPSQLARELALRGLHDGDVEVQLYAARAAGALGVEGAGDAVVEWLQDAEPRLRAAACGLIEAAPSPQSVAALARVLGDAKASVRVAAASAMGSSGLADAVSPLLGLLDDGSTAVRVEVVRALGRIGDVRAVLPLVSKLQDQDSEVRREAARALGQLGDTRAVSSLVLALQDRASEVRAQVIEALGTLGAADAVTALAALLGESQSAGAAADVAVRAAALRALGSIRTPAAIQLLVEALGQEGPVGYREGAAPARTALRIAGPSAVGALVAALDGSPPVPVGSALVLALGELGAPETVDAVVRAGRRGAVPLGVALEALARLGDKRAVPFVLEHLDDPDERVRRLVVEVAAELLEPSDHDGRAVDVVRARALDLSAPLGERVALVRLLGRTGSPRALPILLPLADSKTMSLRVVAVTALGDLGASAAAVDAALLRGIGHGSQRLRQAAAGALGRVATEDATRVLLQRLSVMAEQDREAIGAALSGALGRSRDPRLVSEMRRLLPTLPAASRDAVIEGLGRMPLGAAGVLLAELRKLADVDDRRKVAEALAGHRAEQPALLAMLGDVDPTVRAGAAWSLGRVGDAAALAALLGRLGDLDVAVAGNAAVAAARVAQRAGQQDKAVAPLCAALGDYRAYVRVGALTGLQGLGKSCPAGAVRRLLLHDRSWRVRLAAARALQAIATVASRGAGSPADAGAGPGPSPPTPTEPPSASVLADEAVLDLRARSRCALEDRDAAVALACARERRARDTGMGMGMGAGTGTGTAMGTGAGMDAARGYDVLVYVVPDGATVPVSRAPYALVLPDGTMRLGVADRRGALFEAAAPAGALSLAVPAALAQ